MTPALWVALGVALLAAIGGVGALVGAVLTHRRQTRSDLTDDLAARLALVEGRLSDLETKHNALWVYCRRLLDFAHRWRRDDAPEVPEMPKELL